MIAKIAQQQKHQRLRTPQLKPQQLLQKEHRKQPQKLKFAKEDHCYRVHIFIKY